MFSNLTFDAVRGSRPRLASAIAFIGLLQPRQRVRLIVLVGERIALGLCDLLLAGAMYLLLLQLQASGPIDYRPWLPHSALATACWTISLVVVRLVLDLLTSYTATRFTQKIFAELQWRLMQGYGEMHWNDFVQRNRSELVKHATTTALDAAYSYQVFTELLGSAIVVLAMALSLILQSLTITVGLSCLVLCLYASHRCFLAYRLKDASTTRDQTQRTLHRILTEVLASAKEVRAYGNQQFFYDRLRVESKKLGGCNTQLAVLPQILRIVAEQGVVLLFLGIIVWVLARSGDIHHLLSLLIFYFVVSRRMLPMISQVALLNGQLEGAFTNLQIVRQELELANVQRAPWPVENLPDSGFVLQLDHVFYAFHGGRSILEDVTFSIHAGEIVLLRGNSGSGKSSLLNVISGVAAPDAGAVRIDRAHMAYVPQEIILLDDSVRSNLLFGLDMQSDSDLMQALNVANLDDFVSDLPQGLETRVGDNGVLLSGGQRQRLGIARAALRHPKLILLDEGTSALDHENERQILRRLVELSMAVLLVTHRVYASDVGDRFLLLADGRLVETEASA